MKVLYVDCNVEAVNPTASLTPLIAMQLTEDITFFGPGFSSHDEVRGGLARFAEKAGPFDVVFLGPHAPVLHSSRALAEASADYLARFCALSPPRDLLRDFLLGLPEDLARVDSRCRFTSLLNFDYYATASEQLERIEELDLDIWGPNRAFVARLEELPAYATQEKHYKAKAHRLSDAFADFLERQPERVFPAVHFVADTEFSVRHLDERCYMVGVPGVEYVLRRQAIAILHQRGVSIAPKRAFQLYRVLGRLGLNIYARYLTLKLYQLTFRQSLFDTRFIYTARGGFGIPIRKFFEIPAAGAVLLCSPPNGFGALGYRNGVSFVEVSPEQLPAAIEGLVSEPDRAVAIAREGLRVTMRSHSLSARAAQLRTMLEARLAGRYRGARWVDGQLELISSNA